MFKDHSAPKSLGMQMIASSYLRYFHPERDDVLLEKLRVLQDMVTRVANCNGISINTRNFSVKRVLMTQWGLGVAVKY